MFTSTHHDAGVGRNVASTATLPIVVIAHRDLRVRRALARCVSPQAIVRPAPDAATLQQLVERHQVAGVILELEIPGVDIDGLLDQRLLVIAADADLRTISRLTGRGADIVAADEPTPELTRRVRGFATRLREQRDQRRASAQLLAQRYRLTPAETEVLVLFVGGTDRGELADALGIAETSVRSRVRGVCRKLEVPHLEHVYRLLFEANLEGAA